MEPKKSPISYLNNISLVLLGLLLMVFPVIFSTFTTDFFTLPKQMLLGGIVLIALCLFVVRMIIEGSVKLKRTYFDLPLILFIVTVLLSSIFAVNRFDSLISFASILFAALTFFVVINNIRSHKSAIILTASLLLGAVIVSIISILSYLKIYLIPLAITKAQTFSPLGSLLDQAIYLGILFPIGLFLMKNSRAETGSAQSSFKKFSFIAMSIVILIGFLLTTYQVFTPDKSGQKLIILPYSTGLQTAFATISQDANRFAQGFLFGSGFGTFSTDFTRFKQTIFNQDKTLWTFTFSRSSSFILELLATTGILGLLSFLFLLIRLGKVVAGKTISAINPISLSLVLAVAALFLLPVGFSVQALFFILLGLFAVMQGLKKEGLKRFFDIELQLVALKKGLFNFESLPSSSLHFPEQSNQSQKDASRILPYILGIVIFLIVGFLGFYSIRYLLSDLEFQSSLVSASKNKGQETYQKQAKAISIFPFRDGYYRIFSQTNLSLANSIASTLPKDSSPSAKTQRDIYTLIQQSINAGRGATAISPQTTLNWQNLSSIYRSLIGFGQNAESFAIATQQQAMRLDPNNPQQYIALGGIYYQLGLWENAQTQFQIAVTLKPDFPNARYNLGHALENKGDLKNALTQYQTVKGLIASDQNSLKQITSEIETLQSKIEGKENPATPAVPQSNVAPLNLSTPSAQLPPQNPPVKIPPPTSSTESGR